MKLENKHKLLFIPVLINLVSFTLIMVSISDYNPYRPLHLVVGIIEFLNVPLNLIFYINKSNKIFIIWGNFAMTIIEFPLTIISLVSYILPFFYILSCRFGILLLMLLYQIWYEILVVVGCIYRKGFVKKLSVVPDNTRGIETVGFIYNDEAEKINEVDV